MKGHILIIDDNPLDLKVASLLLEREGFSCHGFLDVTMGLEWLEKNTPQYIIVDLEMPEISGFDAIKGIRKLANLKTCPIVVVSGKQALNDVRRAIQLGANDYIVKPIDHLVLQEKLEKLKAKFGSYFEVSLPEPVDALVMIPHESKVTNLSEFGLKLTTNYQIHLGDTIELGNLPTAIFESDRLLMRCLAVETKANGDGPKTYIGKFTFLALSEKCRQALRLYCRQTYIQGKQEAA